MHMPGNDMSSKDDSGSLGLKEHPSTLDNGAAPPPVLETSPSFAKFIFRLLSVSQNRKYYFSVTAKFLTTSVISLLWAALSVYLSLPWVDDLARHISYPLA